MYGIFSYIYHKFKPDNGKYTIHGAYGILTSHLMFFFNMEHANMVRCAFSQYWCPFFSKWFVRSSAMIIVDRLFRWFSLTTLSKPVVVSPSKAFHGMCMLRWFKLDSRSTFVAICVFFGWTFGHFHGGRGRSTAKKAGLIKGMIWEGSEMAMVLEEGDRFIQRCICCLCFVEPGAFNQ